MAAKRTNVEEKQTLFLDADIKELGEAVGRVVRKYEKPTVTPVDICAGAQKNFNRAKKAWEDAGKPKSGAVFNSFVAAAVLVQMWCFTD